ncbi:MAG: NADH-quinone oxidoreductase subunit J [candidate division Zixibacteria bacterium]|nr:NADH-quinone oxidoreductase subunit J [candidate division Zixibacteria bacterium]NIR64241.1 NADH-quinone oxidoreductase subunit J [candidate division Zixibacteria bacterium]NIW40292.1 NADH-quinone oxidoreductase subunit J [candidate division Zixibacteria bacterium]NIX79932.1 NADH-quinone oxidoreductase subunit J [candidate division Zixibacteria bacterium]
MTLEYVIFFASALVAIVCALLVISQKNPVASVIFLIMAFVAQAILYIQLSALFVAVLQIVVYAGAIMVLFLFVIMLLNLRRDDFGPEKHPIQGWLTRIFGIVLVAELIIVIARGVSQSESVERAGTEFGNVEQVATTLFTKYVFPFELTSILLIVAIIGAVVLGKRRQGEK